MSDEVAFREALAASESLKASDIGAAKLLTGDDVRLAIKSADRAHFARTVAAGIANGINCASARANLNFDPIPSEIVDRTDEATFVLQGGRYLVSVDGTFGPGTITLIDADAFVHASFTETGTATLDLRFGDYNFVLTDVSNLVASMKDAPYF